MFRRTRLYLKKWNDLPSLTKFLVFSFAVLIIYTIVEFITSTITGVSHDTLTTSFFLCFGGAETFGAAVIKAVKVHKENDNDNELDD